MSAMNELDRKGARRPSRGCSRFARSTRGAAAVEFAIVVPVLLLIVFAVIDFGKALYTLNVLTSAVREGARVAAVQPTLALASDSAKAKVANYIKATLDPSFSGTVTASANTPTTGLITVGLAGGYTYVPITPFASSIGLASVTFNPTAVFRWELSY